MQRCTEKNVRETWEKKQYNVTFGIMKNHLKEILNHEARPCNQKEYHEEPIQFFRYNAQAQRKAVI